MSVDLLRHLARSARPVLHGGWAIPIRKLKPRLGLKIAFLPAYGRHGAALLRIYNIAAVLRAQGVDAQVLHWKFTLAQRRRRLAALRPDVVVMQGTRHPLNRPALYPEYRIVLDLDDADFHLAHLAPSVCAAMPRVMGVTAGSKYIADWCRRAGVRETHVVWTGAPVSVLARRAQSTRAPIVAWGQTRPMSYHHEADLVRRVMRQVALRHPGVTLRLYDRCSGDDPAFAQSFAAPGLTVEWYAQARYQTFLDSLDDVSLGLAPLIPINHFCRAKSFGKLLAYFDRHVPVVASDFGEPRAFFTKTNGALCNADTDWVETILDLLSNTAARQSMADAGFLAFKDQLSAEASGARMLEVLTRIVGTPSAVPDVVAVNGG